MATCQDVMGSFSSLAPSFLFDKILFIKRF